MYSEFYGFSSTPFSLNPDPAFTFASGKFESAQAILDYAVIQREGIFVVTGEVGCGKTTLIYSLLNRIQDESAVGVICNPAELNSMPLLGILRAFNQQTNFKYEAELYARFQYFLENQNKAGRAILLIVDEAQSLSIETLEALRRFTNPEPHSRGVLQLVLVGQSLLNQTLQLPELRDLMQRVVTHYHLPALSKDETIKYILYRLMRSECCKALFTVAALIRIYKGSHGIPRVINMICDTALMYGYAQDLHKIDEHVIAQVIADRGVAESPDQQPSLQHIGSPALESDRSSTKLLSGRY